MEDYRFGKSIIGDIVFDWETGFAYKRDYPKAHIPDKLYYPASYIIYKENNRYYAKNGRTGEVEKQDTDAATVIQYAINNLNAGTVYIKAGTYLISSPITINKSAINIIGEGWGTLLKLANGANCDLIKIDSSEQDVYLPQLMFLHLDGNKANNTSGSAIHASGTNQIYDVLLFHVNTFSFPDNALKAERGHAWRIISCDFETCGGDGVYLSNVTNFSFFGCHIGGNTGKGIYVDSANGINFDKCYVLNNGGHGIHIYYSYYNYLSNIYVNSNNGDGILLQGGGRHKLNNIEVESAGQNGIKIWSASYTKLSNIIIRNASQSADNTYDGLAITSAEDIDVSGITVLTTLTNKPNDAISIDDASSKVKILIGNLSGYTVNAIRNLATDTKIEHVFGYTNKNSGTATIPAGSTSVTVSHGLVAAPSKVLVTPIGDPGDRYWVENITDTSFDIVVATAPTADIDFYWEAEV